METKKIYHVGDIIPETALYECEVCGDEKKPFRLRLKKGEVFPQCERCEEDEVWKKASSTLDMSFGCHC